MRVCSFDLLTQALECMFNAAMLMLCQCSQRRLLRRNVDRSGFVELWKVNRVEIALGSVSGYRAEVIVHPVCRRQMTIKRGCKIFLGRILKVFTTLIQRSRCPAAHPSEVQWRRDMI